MAQRYGPSSRWSSETWRLLSVLKFVISYRKLTSLKHQIAILVLCAGMRKAVEQISLCMLVNRQQVSVLAWGIEEWGHPPWIKFLSIMQKASPETVPSPGWWPNWPSADCCLLLCCQKFPWLWSSCPLSSSVARTLPSFLFCE